MSEKLRIVWEGSFFTSIDNSLARVNRNIAERLINKNQFEVSLTPLYKDEFEVIKNIQENNELAKHLGLELTAPTDIHISHHWPPPINPPTNGKWIIFQPWEFGSISHSWLLNFRHRVDEIWVYSNYNKECYIEDGIPEDKIKVIPLGVDTSIYFNDKQPPKTQYTSKSKKSFKFLFVGGTIFRKGIDLLLKAYEQEFSPFDDVSLIIKGVGANSFYSKGSLNQKIEEMENNPNLPEIIYIDDDIPEQDMKDFYKECDCLVHPYRGEGFGLPAAEAMACGLPVILTHGGACDDFTNDNIVYYLNNVHRSSIDIAEPTARQPWVLEPNLQEIAQNMRSVFENKDEAKQKGDKASEFILNNFTWNKTAEKVSERIEAQKDKSPARYFYSIPPHNKPDELFIKAEEYVKNEDYNRASHLYLELLGKLPKSYEVPAGLGIIAWYQNRFEEAKRWFEESIKLNPLDEDTLFNYCDVCLKLNKPDDAVTALKKTLSLKPTLSEVARYLERLYQENARGGGIRFEIFVGQRESIKLGEKLLREGLVNEAQKTFMEALERDPEDFEALCDMGIINYYLKNYEEAYSWFIKSLQVAPTVQDTLINLFDVALKLKRVELITPALKQAIEIRPELSGVKAIIEKIEEKKENIYFVENYDHIDPIEDSYSRGVELLESGELNKATLAFLDVIDNKPYHDRAFNGLGLIAFYRNNLHDAFALLKHAVGINPLNTDAVLNWYDVAKKIDLQAEVKPYLENIADIDDVPEINLALNEIDNS